MFKAVRSFSNGYFVTQATLPGHQSIAKMLSKDKTQHTGGDTLCVKFFFSQLALHCIHLITHTNSEAKHTSPTQLVHHIQAAVISYIWRSLVKS